MPDASYIIDLILRARDDTAAAFASALGNQEAFNAALKDAETQAERNARAYQRASDDIRRSSKETAAGLKEVEAANKRILDQQVAVEQAAKRVARVEADQTTSRRERLKQQIDANEALRKAQAQLAEMMRNHAIEEQRAAANVDKLEKDRLASIKRQTTAQVELERLTENKIRKGRAAQRNEIEAARERIQAIDAEIAAASRLDATTSSRISRDARNVSTERLKLEQLKEQDRVLKQLEVSSRKFVDTQDASKAIEFSREIDRQAEALVRLGRARSEVEDLKVGIKTERADVQFNTERNRIAKEEAAATVELQKFVDDEVKKSRAEREAALIEADRNEAAERAARLKSEIASEKAAEQERRAIARRDVTRGKEAQSQERLLSREREGALRRIRLAASGLSDLKITPEDFDEFRREILLARQEYTRLGGSGRAAQEEIRKALDETGASISKEHRLRLQSLRGHEDEVRAKAEITKATKAYVREIDRAGVAQAQLDRATTSTVKGEAEKIEAIQRELELRKRAAQEAGRNLVGVTQEDVVVNVDLDTGRAVTQAALFEAVKKELGRDIHINVDLDVGAAALGAAAMKSLGGSSNAAANGLKNATNAVATIDNVLRGFLTLGVVLFLNQIVVGAIAAAGALMALASSAIYAGGALGGALTAGAAQAIPVLGVLGVAIQRFSKVVEAVKQSNLLQQQQAGNAGKIAKGVSDATDRVTTAEEALANAHRRSREAQEGINLARQQAARALQNLILQEREAELAARGAALSQVEAQRELRRALSEGDTGAVARARLAVDAAPVAIDRAQQALTTTRQDLRARQTGEAPEVKAAKEQARAAGQAVAQAVRGLESARRAAKETGEESLAAAGKLDYLMSRLSKNEQRLVRQLTSKGGLLDTFNAIAQKVGDPIIASVSNMLDKVGGLVQKQNVFEPFIRLSEIVATQMEKVFDAFTTEEVGKQFLFFIEEAGKNLPLLTDIAINLGQAFLGLGEAGAPVLTDFLEYLVDLTDKFEEFVNSVDGQNALKDFFEEGFEQVKAIMDLMGAFGELFLSVANPDVGGGATAGKSIIVGTTDALRDLNDVVNSPEGREKLQEFFANTIEVLKAMKPIVLAVAEAIDRVFDEGGVKSFKAGAEIISDVLIPALTDLIEFMGLTTRIFALLIDIPVVGFFLRVAIAVSAFYLIIGRLVRLLLALPIIGPILTKLGLAFRALAIRVLGAQAAMLFWRLEMLRAAVTARLVAGLTAISNALRAMTARLALTRAGMIALSVGQRIAAASTAIWTAAMWLLNAAFLGSPIGLIVLAIIGLIAVFVIAYKKSETFRNIVRGAFRAVKNAAENAFEWLKKNWPLVLAILTGPFGLAVLAIVKNWDTIKNTFNDGVDALKGFASDIGDALDGVFDGFVEGATTAINAVIDIFNAGIDLINSITPGEVKAFGKTIIPAIPDIPSIPHLATGGMIGGNFAEGDKYTVKVAGEEVILNPIQQLMIGKDRIMGALRATGAQFLKPGGSYATGGFPQTDISMGYGGSNEEGPRRVKVNVDADTDGQAKKWRLMWLEINASTRRNAQIVEARIRLMRVNITNTVERLYKDFSHEWQKIENSAKRHATDLYRGVRGSINELSKTIYSGMSYIGNATNTVLKTFDAEPVSFSLSPPKTSRAATGYFGNPGERGGDAIPIVVGRGEGIINWAHQKFIEPALHAMYGFGLQDLFKRVGGYHAGGHDEMGMPGFAQGGFTGPFGSGAAFNAISNFAKSKFGLAMTSGKTNHSLMTASGNVSDHSRGWAGDFSNGVLTPEEDAFSGFWKSKLPQVVKQLIWRNVDQFQGFPVGGHEDHVHLAVKEQYAFDNSKMARLISRAMRGLKISDLLGKVTGDLAEVDHVDPQRLRGKRGPLFSIIQKILRKVRGAANKFIDNKFGSTPTRLGDGTPMHGEPYSGPLNRVFPQHSAGQPGTQLSPQQVMDLASKAGLPGRTFEQIAHGESNYMPGVVSHDGGYGLWQMTPRVWGPAGIEAMNKLGGLRQMLNPWKNALMAKYLYGQAGNTISPWFGTKFVTAARGLAPNVARYARGGFVGGSGPFSAFRRAATGLSTLSADQERLREMRRSTSYIAPDLLPIDYEGVVREFNLAVRQIRRVIARRDNEAKKLHARVASINKNLGEITSEGGLLDKMGDAIERFGKTIAIKLRERVLKIGRLGIVTRGLDPATEAAELQKNSQALLRRNQALLRRINTLLKDSDVELGRVNRRIASLERKGSSRTKAEDEDLKDLRDDKNLLVSNQRNLRNRALEAREAIADQLDALYQAQIEQFNKQTESAVAEAGGAGGQKANDFAIRIAEAFGQSTTLLQNRRIEIMRAQQQVLLNQLAVAQERGYADEAATLTDQIQELNTTIEEATAALLTNAVAEAQTAFDRVEASFGIQERLNSLRERLGDRVGAAQATTATLQGRQGALTGQRDTLIGFLAQAQAQGNIALTNELTDKIVDLNTQLQENARAIQESIIATRQLSLTLITDRSARSTGLIGSATDIIKKIGSLSGTDDVATLAAFAQQMIDTLTSSAQALISNIKQTLATGIFSPQSTTVLAQLAAAFEDGPQSFASTLVGLNAQIAALEETMGQAEREAFQALIQAMIDNTSATLDAASELAAINGQGIQQFTSSAWSWFRLAIFNGLGGLTPAFQVPHLNNGGYIETAGLANLHPGEVYTAATVSNRSMASTVINEGDINTTINEAGHDLDPTHLSELLAFKRRSSGNRRS